MVGLGDTAKKIQTVADRAEQTYKRLEELRQQVNETRETVNDTHERVSALETEMTEQRALLEALAAESGVDVDAVLTEAVIQEAEPDIQVRDDEQ
jgi:methyl-accepting chemotaxis protein